MSISQRHLRIGNFIGFAGIFIAILVSIWQDFRESRRQNDQFEKNLILEAVQFQDRDQTLRNIQFLVENGFIDADNSVVHSIIKDTVFRNRYRDTVIEVPLTRNIYISEDRNGMAFQVVDRNSNQTLRGVYFEVTGAGLNRGILYSGYSDTNGLISFIVPDGAYGLMLRYQDQILYNKLLLSGARLPNRMELSVD